jgi:hypothetical protein
VPRAAVVPYAQLAAAGLWYMHDEVARTGDEDMAAISMPVSDAIVDAAEIVLRAAWSAPAVRWFWLRRALRASRRAVDAIDEKRFVTTLDYARRTIHTVAPRDTVLLAAHSVRLGDPFGATRAAQRARR